jgi:hypothetical protein
MNEESTQDQPRQKLPVKAGGRIAAMIPTDIDQAYRFAQALAGSGMTPKAFNNDPNKILVGIIAGMEVGLAPFQALQSIAVINGNPSLWGDGALALIQGSGLLVDIEETDDGDTATCRLVRKDRETPIIRQFSNAMAKSAGLLGKAGPWTQYQARMRQMRARSWAMRDGFPDVLKGIGIAEEVRDVPANSFSEEAPPRITRAALAYHASGDISESQQEEVYEAETGEIIDDAENDAAIEREVERMNGQVQGEPSQLWQSLIIRANEAASIDQINLIQDEFDVAEQYVPLDRQGEVQSAIDAARDRLASKI